MIDSKILSKFIVFIGDYITKKLYNILNQYFRKKFHCQSCGKYYFVSLRDILYIKIRGFKYPKRCYNCLTDDDIPLYTYVLPHIITWENEIKSNPYLPRNYYSLAWYYSLLRNYKKSINISKKALKINPNYQEALHSIGYSYYELNNFTKALNYFYRIKQNYRFYDEVKNLINKCKMNTSQYL